MLQSFSDLQRSHPVEDELLNCLLCLGVCKAVSIIGTDQDTLDRLRRTVEFSLRSAHLPSKVCGLHGLLYLLQSEVLQPDQLAQLLPLASDYLRAHLSRDGGGGSSPVGQSEQHAAATWALAFYVLENFEHELQVCCRN